MKQNPPIFPPKVDSYLFVKELDTLPSRNADVHFGLYESPEGKKAMGKLSSSPALLHEATMYELLTVAQKRIQGKRFFKKHVKIPNLIGFINNGSSALLLTEYCEGDLLGEADTTASVRVYESVLSYIAAINASLTDTEKQSFPTRSGYQMFLVYPLLLVKAMIAHPQLIWSLLLGLLVVWRGWRGFFRTTLPLVLTHRDLHGKNILVKGNTVTVLDFQYMALTIPQYEQVSLLALRWNSVLLREAILAHLPQNPETYAVMMYCVTLMLSSKNFSEKRYGGFVGLLQWIEEKSFAKFRDPSQFTLLQRFVYIIPTYLHSSLLYVAGRRREVTLPKTIGEYALMSPVPSSRKYPYAVGYYQDQKQKTVIIKVWKGKHFTLHAFNLLHESTVCRILTDVRRRIIAQLPLEFIGIQTPEFIECFNEGTLIAVVMKPAQGVPLSQKNDTAYQIHVYEEVKAYLAAVGDAMTDEERNRIGAKTLSYFLITYPFIFCMSLFRHLDKSVEILSGGISFLAGTFSLSSEPTMLVHGDLHVENIFVSRAGVTLIDLEQVVFTYPEFDLIAALSTKRNTDDYRLRLQTMFTKQAQSDHTFAARFAAMGAMVSIHNLTSNLSPVHTAHYFEMLKFSNGIKKFLPNPK